MVKAAQQFVYTAVYNLYGAVQLQEHMEQSKTNLPQTVIL